MESNSPTCPACGATLDENQARCPNCWTALHRPGFFRRLLDFLLKQRPRAGSTTQLIVRGPSTKLWIIDKGTGERRSLSSLEDLPPEIREQLAQAEAFGNAVQKSLSVSFQGLDGQKRTFHSVQEMPPEIRKMCEDIVLPEIKGQLGELLDEGKSSSPSQPAT